MTEQKTEATASPRAARKQLTAADAVQRVLADPQHAANHTGAHYTEHHAVELLVKAGVDREQAERDVRGLLY